MNLPASFFYYSFFQFPSLLGFQFQYKKKTNSKRQGNDLNWALCYLHEITNSNFLICLADSTFKGNNLKPQLKNKNCVGCPQIIINKV